MLVISFLSFCGPVIIKIEFLRKFCFSIFKISSKYLCDGHIFPSQLAVGAIIINL